MSFQPIPGLAYFGHQVYVDDGASSTTGPVDSPAPPPPTYVSQTTVPASRINPISDDNFFLTKMIGAYQKALSSIPGGHSIYYDMLTDTRGRTYSDGVPQPIGTVKDPTLKNIISNLINAGSYEMPQTFDVSKYNGPLRQIYNNLVAHKLHP